MNPLYNDFKGRYAEVPFSEIKTEHFEPAIERGIKLAKDEIEAICTNEEAPDFKNTIVALEKAGKDLDRVLNVFYPLNSALSDDELKGFGRELNMCMIIVMNIILTVRIICCYPRLMTPLGEVVLFLMRMGEND